MRSRFAPPCVGLALYLALALALGCDKPKSTEQGAPEPVRAPAGAEERTVRERTDEYRQNAFQPLTLTRDSDEIAPGVSQITVYNWSLTQVTAYLDGIEIFSGTLEPTRAATYELQSGLYDVFVGDPRGTRTPAWQRIELAGSYSVDITSTHQGEQAADLGMQQRGEPAYARRVPR